MIQHWSLGNREMEETRQAEDVSAGTVVPGSQNPMQHYVITFEEALSPDIPLGALLNAGCWEPEEYICRNSVFRNIAGAGHLIRCRNVLLEKNRYETIMCAGIMLGAELDTHCESDHVSNIRIKDNYFCNIGTKPRYGIYGCACVAIKSQGFEGPFNEKISIEHNVFAQSSKAIEIYDAREVAIRDNIYRDVREKVYIHGSSTRHIWKEDEEK